MSDIFSTIGSFLNSGAGQGILKGGAVGGSFLQNWLANREAQQKQKFVEQLVTNPQKWASFVAGKTQPLQAGLTQDVAREADAYGAERGLGSSPAVMKDVFAQALAPYLMAQRQQGENAAENALSLYEGSPTTRPVDFTSLLKLFLSQSPQNANVGSVMRSAAIPPGGVPTDISTLPNQIPYSPDVTPQPTLATLPDQIPFSNDNLISMGGI